MLPLLPKTPPADRKWVDDIQDPKQRILALAIPVICELAGIKTLTSHAEERSVSDLLRCVVVGAIVSLGRDLGLRRVDLQGPTKHEQGTTEIRDLVHYSRWMLRRSEMRFEQFCAEAGIVGRAFRDAYSRIQYEAMVLVRGVDDSLRQPKKPGRKTNHQRIEETLSQSS